MFCLIACQVSFESACPFPESFNLHLLSWDCVIYHLARQIGQESHYILRNASHPVTVE